MTPPLRCIEIGKSTSGKTNIYHVECNGIMLGVIKWFTNWKRYCFYPERNTIFDSLCLSEIHYKLRVLTETHKEKCPDSQEPKPAPSV